MKIASSLPSADMFYSNGIGKSRWRWLGELLLKAGFLALVVMVAVASKSLLVAVLIGIAIYKVERVEKSMAELRLSVSKLRADAESLADRLPQGQVPEAFRSKTSIVDPDLLALQKMLGLRRAGQHGLSSPNTGPTDEP